MRLPKSWLVLICIITQNSLRAQNNDLISQVPCNNPTIQHQADSIQTKLQGLGFTEVAASMVSMRSQFELPISFVLSKGVWYHFVFIGEPTSKLFEIRMFDWNEKQVYYEKKKRKDKDGNVVSFAYVPKFTEMHLIKPVQVNKQHAKVCGYVMVFRRVRP